MLDIIKCIAVLTVVTVAACGTASARDKDCNLELPHFGIAVPCDY
jgi:hypothetical protein